MWKWEKLNDEGNVSHKERNWEQRATYEAIEKRLLELI